MILMRMRVKKTYFFIIRVPISENSRVRLKPSAIAIRTTAPIPIILFKYFTSVFRLLFHRASQKYSKEENIYGK